jgi:hypothetical protein
MTPAVASIAPLTPLISKLVRLLGSDQDHEALGAVRALRRTLGAAKLDLNDLADLIEITAHNGASRYKSSAADSPFSHMRRTSTQNEVVREMLKRCRERPELLSNKELMFVCSIAKWRGPLSPGQLAWLVALHERVSGPNPAAG